MWRWAMTCLITLTAAYINPKCTNLISIVQFFDKCKYDDGRKIVNCTDLPLLRLGPDIVQENVEIVYVDKCCITFIPENTFQDSTQLRHLDASHNLMRTLKEKLFRSTTQLSHLDVSYNFIKTLDYRTFVGLNKLSYLDLSNNLLEILDYRIFKDTNVFSYLDFSYNYLNVLDYRLFEHTCELSYLNLSNNNLDILDYRLLISANKLLHLNLSHNNLEILDYRIFISITELSHLDLSSNSLEILDERLFNSLKDLVYLNLKNNKLVSLINTTLFNTQRQLITLLLGHNNISKIDVEILKPLECIEELDLSGNPLFSNCEVYLNTTWFPSEDMEDNYTCHNLLQLKDIFWNIMYSPKLCHQDIREEHSTGSFPTEIIAGISVAFILLCVIACLSILLWKRNSKSRPRIDSFAERQVPHANNNCGMNNFVYDDIGDNYETIGMANTSTSDCLRIINHITNPEYDYIVVDHDKASIYSSSYIKPT